MTHDFSRRAFAAEDAQVYAGQLKVSRETYLRDRYKTSADLFRDRSQWCSQSLLDFTCNAFGTDGHSLGQLSFDFCCLVPFDDVAIFKVVVALQTDTAFVSGIDFTNIVLVALERRQGALVNLESIT